MTSSLENVDSTVNKKHGTQTVLTYAQSFASSKKESIKRLVERAIDWLVEFPKRKKNSSILLFLDEKREMREWESSNSAVVRQGNGRGETAIVRSGTLPENTYYKELK